MVSKRLLDGIDRRVFSIEVTKTRRAHTSWHPLRTGLFVTFAHATVGSFVTFAHATVGSLVTFWHVFFLPFISPHVGPRIRVAPARSTGMARVLGREPKAGKKG